MNPITIPVIGLPTIGLPTIGIPPVGFPSASGGGLVWPAGLKESIKAIYDPASQGMTNYDVIESYAEDFTNWIFRNNVADATIANNKLIITETKAQNDRFIYSTNANEDLILYITGIDTVGVCYYNGSSTLALNNGLNKIHTNKGYIDIRSCRGIGACNITITQLPTSILKDLSGNGNHAYLYGGKGKLNSGMGVYNYVFDNGRNVQDSILNKKYTVYISDTPVNGNLKFKVATLNPNTIDFSFEIVEKDVDGKVLSYNGMKTPTDTVDFKPRDNTATIQLRIRYDSFATTGDIQLGIQLLPNAYPNQLCYDGKMYAVCYGFPILTDYTVMAERTWFDEEEHSAFVSNSLGGMEDPSNGAFSVEVKSLDSFTVMSFGSLTSISTPEKGITYQTKQSYNGNSINVGTKESNDILILGGRYFYKNDNVAGNTWIGCHGTIIIADRSFTEDEITWLKDNWKKI